MRSLRESSLAMTVGLTFNARAAGWAKRRAPTRAPRAGAALSRLCPPYRGVPRDDGSLVHVLQIAPSALERADRLLGDLGSDRLHVGIGLDQRAAHVLGHLLGVAADIEIGAVLEPLDQLAAAIPQAVLDVDLLRRVAREGDVHAGQRPVLQGILPFELVEEVVGVVAVAEEQPGFSGGARAAALLDEAAERRDAGARTHHDDVAIGRRQAEMLVGPQLHPHAVALAQALGDEARRHAGAAAPMAVVAHRRNQQMRLVADLAARRRDRISARWRRRNSRPS